ncbi:Chromophore lyase CRL [Hibiscus syriacus]|uniref:Chromophore lyase CRL n=1 Tax=Hibiscus syriacus TaxID=106335 RepID=A0A6A3A1Y6_HIBSY|nr:Chromophore lyase CRL [Hibiscus syriacus]
MESDSNGWSRARGLILKTLLLIGGALFLKRLTKSTTRWDHAKIVARSLSGEKFSQEQASRNPDSYFNIRTLTCPATEMADGSKDLKCDVEVSTYAIRDMDEYKNFCDRARDHRPLPEEVIDDVAEHLTTIHLKRCERGKRCLYEGSTPPGGFPNSWNGATHSISELSVLKNNEIHTWDRGYDDDGNQVWGVKEGPYEFKPVPASSFNLNFAPSQPMEKRTEGSFVLEE